MKRKVKKKPETSGKRTAALASDVMRDPKASKTSKSLAASVLTQAPDKRKKRPKRKRLGK